MTIRPQFADATNGFTIVPAMTLTVDGTVIVTAINPNTASYPIVVTTANNFFIVTLNKDSNDHPTIKIMRTATLSPLTYQAIPITLTITKSGYDTFTNSFTVYGYDLGNNNAIATTLTNPPFNIYLSPTGNSTQTSGVIAYRRPFTDQVFYYRNTSSYGSVYTLTPTTTGIPQVLGTGSNGFFTLVGAFTLTAKNGTAGTTTVPNLGLAVTWFPAPLLSVTPNTSCDEDSCFSIIDANIASVDALYTGLTTVYVDGVRQYAFINQQIKYTLYDNSGNIIATQYYGDLVTYPFVLDVTSHIWNGFILPEEGSYIVEVCISAWDDFTNLTIADDTVDSGDLNIGQWFRIKAHGTTDFTPFGAPNNTIGTVFMVTVGGTPVWDSSVSTLTPLGKEYECCVREDIKGCTWGNIRQIECNKYRVTNISFDTVIVVVAQMTTLGVFEPVENGSYSLTPTGYIDIIHDTDGIYTYTITDVSTDDTIPSESSIFVIQSYCNLRSCWLDNLNKVICCKCDKCQTNCNNYWKDFYDFNNLIILTHTYFNILNTEYAYNFVYTFLDPSKVAELYEAKQFLDKLKDYCELCSQTTTCKSCS